MGLLDRGLNPVSKNKFFFFLGGGGGQGGLGHRPRYTQKRAKISNLRPA